MKKKNTIKSLIWISCMVLGTFASVLQAQKKSIEVSYEKNDDNSVDFYFKKNVPGSYHLTIKFSELSNSLSIGFKGVVKNSSGHLFSIEPTNSKKRIGFAYKISRVRGTPNPKVDSLFAYALPFKNGKKMGLIEYNNVGQKYFNNEVPKNWKSYGSFRINPDTVYAMRKGIVVSLLNKYDSNTEFDKSYSSKQNRLLIEHDDGTYAEYKGFKRNSFFVKLGQTVYPKTKLGILDKFNDAKFGHRLTFSIHYLVDTKPLGKQTITNRKSRHEYITPYFQTSEGVKKLTHKSFYHVLVNDEIVTKEMTRKEIKQFKKNPQKFQ